MLQLYDLCRLCAQKKRNKMDLFTGMNDEDDGILLSKISLLLSIQVTPDDILPKAICTDCQRTVEQFSTFRVKCQKAEERLNKMLALAVPNKLNVTRIKQESDLESNIHIVDPPRTNDQASFLKSLKNVKLEIDESWNERPDLIQIISEEMVQQQLIDMKVPQIEIISENFEEDFKNIECDVKVIPEDLIDPAEFSNQIVIKGDSNEEVIEIDSQKQKEGVEDEIDEKYLTLQQGEVCDIDLEEMDALIKKKQDPNAVFECDQCGKTFKFFKCLRKHKNWHKSQPEVFVCDFCKQNNAKCFEFGSLKTLTSHIQRKHLGLGGRFKCKFCERVMPSQGQLTAHCKKVHECSTVACQICGKIFKNKTRLKDHLKVHQDERPYVCDQCGQTFKWSNALKVHIQWHKQEKNFLCSECGKKFTAKKNLIEHLNIHSGKRPYVCEKCNASFVQLSAYSKHLYLHNEGNVVHKCDMCGKSFSHGYMLRQHLLRHTNLRPFECSTCHRSFKSQSDLCCHVKVHQEKQHVCQVCGKKFAMLKTLKDHMVRHTGIKHKCPVIGCEKSYTQRFTLTKHFSKQHPLLSIVKKKGGKKGHLAEKENPENSFIRYDFVQKELEDQF